MNTPKYNFLLVRCIVEDDDTSEWSVIEHTKYPTFGAWLSVKMALLEKFGADSVRYRDLGPGKMKVLDFSYNRRFTTFMYFPKASRSFLLRNFVD